MDQRKVLTTLSWSCMFKNDIPPFWRFNSVSPSSDRAHSRRGGFFFVFIYPSFLFISFFQISSRRTSPYHNAPPIYAIIGILYPYYIPNNSGLTFSNIMPQFNVLQTQPLCRERSLHGKTTQNGPTSLLTGLVFCGEPNNQGGSTQMT